MGKTALLAEYVKKPPRSVDVLNFFVSEAWGTNTREAFTTEMVKQIRAFLHRSESSIPHPRDPRDWADLFERAAQKSAGRGRRLVLVVDGLDEDMAWGPRTDGGDRQPGTESQDTDRRRSIAALLPARPSVDLRIIVSLRRSVRLPDDVPARHPLRLRECLRVLGASERAAEIRRATIAEADRLRASELGRTAMNLLTVSGGGLRVADLAELADAPFGKVDRLIHGADGRCVVLTDPLTGTYSLGHDEILRSVRQALGPAGVAHHTALLHAWAEAWRASGWPAGTPPYLLMGHLRLLDGAAVREKYVLDAYRQARVAADAGVDIALAQVDSLGAEPGGHATTSEGLGSAARLAASRALLLRKAPQVLPGAADLFVRLGDVPRACALARSASRPVLKAARLAQVAVEVRRAGLPGAASIAEEAAQCADLADHVLPRPAQDLDAYVELADAAHALWANEQDDAARALLRAVVIGGSADSETLVAAAHSLSEGDDRDWVDAVESRADDWGLGTPRDKAAAVEVWAIIADRVPARRAHARSRIMSICDELDPSSEGLATLDVLALAAAALASRKTVAPRLVRTALDRLSAALAEPDQLSPDDQAYLRREVSTTLQRLGQAVRATGIGWHALDAFKELISAHAEMLGTGVLGDDLAERGKANIAAAEASKAAKDGALDRAVEGRKQRQQRSRTNAADSRQLTGRWKTPRGRTASPDPPTGLENRWGHDDRQPEHAALLGEAGQLIQNGNPVLGRERLEAAVRLTPPARTADTTGSAWTPALARALGVIGEFGQAELLASAVPGRGDRARHLAALSMGCSQGGHGPEARRYAREAARLSAGAADPALRGQAAQALAHAGEAADAEELAGRKEPEDTMSTGARRAQIRRSLTVVAAGLARRAPETAARLVGPQVVRLTPEPGFGSPLDPLPQLAELLLAFPDVRQPGSALREAIDGATDLLKKHPQQWNPQALTVLALLEGLKWYPEPPLDAGSAVAWCRTLAPYHVPYAELAVLAAVKGDTAEARRPADAAPTADGRAAALAALATRLAGVPVTLDADGASQDSTVRLCLALAHAAGDGSPPDEPAARSLVRELLAGEGWVRAIPLLPRLAPEALVPLAELVRAHGPDAAGTG
ncbi:hypothetical protein ACIQXD_23250 [Streptomyces uncialis]|uniref:hypothetical protein n=1 Tax=Streptomyces uncialis TaxID=1048205 RepID=UPI00380E88D1